MGRLGCLRYDTGVSRMQGFLTVAWAPLVADSQGDRRTPGRSMYPIALLRHAAFRDRGKCRTVSSK